MSEPPISKQKPGTDWIVGGGEMGQLIRSMDWSPTPLGARESWPQSLRMAINICLASDLPICIIWGPGLVQIYNDAYRVICGDKHPHSMGQSFPECWSEAWPVIGTAHDSALAGNTAFLEDQHIFLKRHGYMEECFFTFSFSPIRDEDGRLAGLFHPVIEMTPKMLGERRTRTVRDLATRTGHAKTIEEAFTLTTAALAEYELDLPFVLIYRLDEVEKNARLVAATGLSAGMTAAPEFVDLAAPGNSSWPLAEVSLAGAAVQVDDVEQRFGTICAGPFPEFIKTAVLLPITRPAGERSIAVLVAGISPRLLANEMYRGFHDLLASAVTAAVASARAYAGEERLATVLEHLPVGVALFDRDGQMALTNASMRRFIGASVPSLDLQRRHRWQACAPDGSQLEFSQWPGRRALRGESVLPGVEFRFTEDDGREIWTTVSATPLHETGGAVVMVEDIDQRKHDELALRASVERFRMAATVMSNIIWTTNAQGMMEGEQPGWGQFTGQTPEEYQAYGWAQAVHPEDAQPTLDAWNAAVAEKRLYDFEHRVRRHDGAWRLCSIHAMPVFGEDGSVREWVGVHNDITVRNDIEAELRTAKSVAETASRAKTDFLSSMSHELRAPLNGILGFAQLLESGSPAPTASQKRSIDQILKAGWYLVELINEILDLAQIEAGKATLLQELVLLSEVMLECHAMVENQATQSGIGLTFPDLETPCFIAADRTRVKQVLINLLFNAIKYNRPGGTVSVEFTLKAPHSIRISVRDTGEGIAPAQLTQLFQPFNRLGKETSKVEGTGIGLVVTKRLVELMGGTIGVESTVGVGSVFWIELGVAAAPEHAVSDAGRAVLARPQVSAGTPQRTVLCVEDNPANLELIEQLIARRPDLRLLSAADGELGIEFARTYQPDVIVMDINLPHISGIEAMEILCQDPLTAHIPVIALSANAISNDIKKGLAAGFFCYTTKPIKVNEFMDALDLALSFAGTAAFKKATAGRVGN